MATEHDSAEPPAEPKIEISQEDFALLQKLKEQQRQQPPTPQDGRSESPKRQKVDEELQTFVDSLADRDIDWMGLLGGSFLVMELIDYL